MPSILDLVLQVIDRENVKSAAMGNNANKLTNKLKIFTKLFIVSEKVATKVND